MEKKQNLVEKLVRETATNKLDKKYNLAQYREGGSKYAEGQRARINKQVCEEIVKFLDETKAPIYAVVICGCQTDGAKIEVARKGYKKFDRAKVEMVMAMGKAYNDHNGIKGKMSDITWRLMGRYYDKRSKTMEQFLADLQASEVLGKKAAERGDFKALCKNLNIPFGKEDNAPLADVA